jgi:hypothetical protein
MELALKVQPMDKNSRKVCRLVLQGLEGARHFLIFGKLSDSPLLSAQKIANNMGQH